MSIRVSVGWVEDEAERPAREPRRKRSRSELDLERERDDFNARRAGFVLAVDVDDDDVPRSAWAW